MNKFLETYPDISVSLLLVDNVELDLSKGQAEVAIRFSRPTDLNLVLRKLMSIRYHVFASSDYLKINGTPKSAADLDNFRLIVYGDEVPAPVDNINWLLNAGRPDGEPRTPALRVNTSTWLATIKAE